MVFLAAVEGVAAAEDHRHHPAVGRRDHDRAGIQDRRDREEDRSLDASP